MAALDPEPFEPELEPEPEPEPLGLNEVAMTKLIVISLMNLKDKSDPYNSEAQMCHVLQFINTPVTFYTMNDYIVGKNSFNHRPNKPNITPHYLHDFTENPVDKILTEITEATTVWICGHGGKAVDPLDPNGEVVTAIKDNINQYCIYTQLIHVVYKAPVCILVTCCNSGSFLPDEIPPIPKNLAIILNTAKGKQCHSAIEQTFNMFFMEPKKEIMQYKENRFIIAPYINDDMVLSVHAHQSEKSTAIVWNINYQNQNLIRERREYHEAERKLEEMMRKRKRQTPAENAAEDAAATKAKKDEEDEEEYDYGPDEAEVEYTPEGLEISMMNREDKMMNREGGYRSRKPKTRRRTYASKCKSRRRTIHKSKRKQNKRRHTKKN
jgi:hypothetical protein